MRASILAFGAFGLLALSFVAAEDLPPAKPRVITPVISTHQIDRYDAIKKTKFKLDQDPKSLADWIILGELTQEAALNVPQVQARDYMKTSRDAYEKALALAPDNAGLKAAVQFARDMEANFDQFEKVRDQATETYLEARRRDLALANYTPTIAVYNPPLPPADAAVAVPAPAPPTRPADDEEVVVNPPLPNTPATDASNYGARLVYGSGPIYQAYVAAEEGAAPYTFQQYSSAYYPPNYYTNPATPAVTLQRYGQTYYKRGTFGPTRPTTVPPPAPR